MNELKLRKLIDAANLSGHFCREKFGNRGQYASVTPVGTDRVVDVMIRDISADGSTVTFGFDQQAAEGGVDLLGPGGSATFAVEVTAAGGLYLVLQSAEGDFDVSSQSLASDGPYRYWVDRLLLSPCK